MKNMTVSEWATLCQQSPDQTGTDQNRPSEPRVALLRLLCPSSALECQSIKVVVCKCLPYMYMYPPAYLPDWLTD